MTHTQTLLKPSMVSRGNRLATQRGNTTVEMGLLLLPFFLMFMGVIEMGWFYYHQHTLQYATREGMRLALVGSTLLDGEGNPMSREDSIITTIKEKTKEAFDPAELQIWIFKVGSNYESPLGWEELAPNAGNPADYMRIKVLFDHQFLVVPLISSFFNDGEGGITLGAEATYRNELFQT